MIWNIAYVTMIVGVNLLFVRWPEHSAAWSIIVGGIFVVRDLAQREVGHWILLSMLFATLTTWWLASPVVAVASASAFAAAELVDWAVYSVCKRPLRDRILVSSAISVPVDSLIFLGMMGILAPWLFVVQVLSKLGAAVLLWVWLTKRALG